MTNDVVSEDPCGCRHFWNYVFTPCGSLQFKTQEDELCTKHKRERLLDLSRAEAERNNTAKIYRNSVFLNLVDYWDALFREVPPSSDI